MTDLYVNKEHVANLSRLLSQNDSARIVLVPQYKSMLDPALMFYCNRALGLP